MQMDICLKELLAQGGRCGLPTGHEGHCRPLEGKPDRLTALEKRVAELERRDADASQTIKEFLAQRMAAAIQEFEKQIK